MTWSTVRDNHLVFWTGGNWAIDPSFTVKSLTAGPGGEEDKVNAALELLYTTSPTFQAMIDGWIASGGQLQIGATTGVTRAVSFGTDPLNRYILLNLDDLEAKNWVNNIGELVGDRLEVSLAHEMIHIYKGYRDLPQESTDANKNGTSYDYAGDTVRYQNKIVAELGADFAHYLQVSYGSVSDSFAAQLGLVENQSYTDGDAIDVWRRGSDGNDTLDHSNRTAASTAFGDAPPQLRDLIFGFAGDDTINGGLGNDHLFGGADNDTLVGGAGDDQLWGGMLDEPGRNDGTDTVRYDSASAGIVINLNGGFGSPIIVQDGDGGTDTLHSIETIKGSSHSDTLVLTDLTPEIASDLDYIDLGAGEDTVDVSALVGTFRFTGSNPADQTLTDGVSVLHLRNVEHIEGNHDTLVLDSSDGVRVDGGAALVAAAGSLFTYADFETIQCGDGNDRVFGGDSGHYIAGGGVNYLEASGTAVLESTTGDTYFSVSDGGTVISGAGNDYIEVTGNAPVTIEFGTGSGHDMLADGYWNDAMPARENSVFGLERFDVIDFVDLMPSDVELVWNWSLLSSGSNTQVGEAAIRIIGTDDTLYLGELTFEGNRPALVGYYTLGTVGQNDAESDTNTEGYAGSSYDDIDVFRFADGTIRNLWDTFDLWDVPSIPLPEEAKAAHDILSNLATGSDGTLQSGTSLNDNLTGTSADEDILAGGGNDVLSGGDGNDFLRGGDGQDSLAGGAGNDDLDGGGGLDTASYASSTAAVTVNLATGVAQDTIGAGIDTLSSIENLIGGSFNDVLTGDPGNNRLDGGDANDRLYGGPGDDTLNGGAGIDTLEGGAGNDALDGGIDRDVVSYANATAGVTVDLSIATAQNTGGAGIDIITNVENLVGSSFNDVLRGNADNNNIKGGGGNDTLEGLDGNDSLEGGDGDDTLISGGNGSDTASYASAATGVHVFLVAAGAQDTVGAGHDTITGCERLTGSAFADTLIGSTNADIITGGDGNDGIRGLGGNDTLTGGNGADIFVFDTALNASTNVDTISDFVSGSDRIKLATSIFSAAGSTGVLSASVFQLGNAANDSQDRIIYDSTTGNIYYDADGNGAGSQILFAHITAGLSLSNSDFYIG